MKETANTSNATKLSLVGGAKGLAEAAVAAKALGSDNEHLKAFVKQGNSESFGAIGFGLGNKLDLVTNKNKFDAIFSLEENEWKDTVTLQLQLRDIR
jgi:single-stranded-DNA-specific exonuclease